MTRALRVHVEFAYTLCVFELTLGRVNFADKTMDMRGVGVKDSAYTPGKQSWCAPPMVEIVRGFLGGRQLEGLATYATDIITHLATLDPPLHVNVRAINKMSSRLGIVWTKAKGKDKAKESERVRRLRYRWLFIYLFALLQFFLLLLYQYQYHYFLMLF